MNGSCMCTVFWEGDFCEIAKPCTGKLSLSKTLVPAYDSIEMGKTSFIQIV